MAGQTSMVGQVQEIGLRRTVLRDSLGAVNAVSNGLIRASSNTTRVFSVAAVELQVLRGRDVDHALAILSRVRREMQEDPAWSDRVLAQSPADIWVFALSLDGASVRLQQPVPPGSSMAVASELRRRLATAFAAEAIGTGRWDTPMPVVTESATTPKGARQRPTAAKAGIQ